MGREDDGTSGDVDRPSEGFGRCERVAEEFAEDFDDVFERVFFVVEDDDVIRGLAFGLGFAFGTASRLDQDRACAFFARGFEEITHGGIWYSGRPGWAGA